MKYEALLTVDEKNKWLELEVTLGTNEALISQDLSKLQHFLKSFNELEKSTLERVCGLSLNLDTPLSLSGNAQLLKLLLTKKFIDQHGLSVIREAKSNASLSENAIFLEILEGLFSRNEYPEQIYVYAVYRQRGTPNTWLKVISDLTPDQVEQKLEDKIKGLQSYINRHLRVSRRFRFKQVIGNLTIIIFSKPIPAKVIKGEYRNFDAQRASYTIVVFDKSENKLGVVTGSKREVLLIQRYVRYRLLPDSIGTPRLELEMEKKEILKKMLTSNPDRAVSLVGASFKNTLLPEQPSLRIKANEGQPLDSALDALSNFWDTLGIDALRNVDYQFQGRDINVYVFGDDWKRIFINTSAKRKTSILENRILDDINERLGTNVKETSFIIENLTDLYIFEKLLSDKHIVTFPAVPKQVEKLIVRLIREKIIKKPKKISKRKCLNCYSFSWSDWQCPNCDRETMVVVGEAVNIEPIESNIVRKLSTVLESDYPNLQITLIPYKQRRNYKKSVIRIYDPAKNLSVFALLISGKKDFSFVEDLLHEGFGVIAAVDPEMSGKTDYLEGLGCDLINLHPVIDRIINGVDDSLFSAPIENQMRRVVERIFSNLRTSINQLNNKPANYNEDMFEIDVTNLFQALVPDVIRLGTEYKGRPVPDGYCCYGYRNSAQRRKKRLLGWDAKYSMNSNYRLGAIDVRKQKGYLNWLCLKNNEPYKMGKLGIYAFISNFDSSNGFETALTNLAAWNNFPNQCRLVLMQDTLLVKICEWLLDHWQQVIDNNSLISEVVFKWFRRATTKTFNKLLVNDWPRLESKLNEVLS